MKRLKRVFSIAVILATFNLTVNLAPIGHISRIRPILADEVDDLERQKQEIEAQKAAKEAAAQKVAGEKEAVVTEKVQTEAVIGEKQEDISQKEGQLETLAGRKKSAEEVLSEKQQARNLALRNFYKFTQTHTYEYFLASAGSGLSSLSRFLSGYRNSLDVFFAKIESLNGQIMSLRADLGIVGSQKAGLEGQVAVLGEQKDFLVVKEGELTTLHTGLKEEILGLENEIAKLNARQQEILAARSGSFTTSVGDVPLTDDFNASPAYNPGFSPAFAAFSFGAYTHRKGMSQYGAKGRAEAGKSYREILSAYYGKDAENRDTGGTINVDGFGPLDFENYYLMGIAEMPASFPFEALKAQAVAARSYAWRYKEQGSSICTSESCQVFSSSKAQDPPPEWRRAVEETRGEVIEGVVTYYSSTTGGYLTTMGWDTTDGQGGGDWTNRAYEAKAQSPWFYKSWYTEGYYTTSAKCGRDHPWLTQEEMADILNALVVLQSGSQEEVDRILPVTSNQCPISGFGGDPYSMGDLKAKAGALGGAYESISGVTTTHSGNGEVSAVVFQTNRGQVTISGADFKKAFNLRAPGYISIRSPLYQIERK
ncbi:MAG: SpoIID/LytB domain-containing protein [bacterium]